MKLFSKKRAVMPLPEGYTPEDIMVEASICTGERTIGFYDRHTKKLMYAEYVGNEEDITAFYEKYGLKRL